MSGRKIVSRPAPPVQADTHPGPLGPEASRPGQRRADPFSHKGVYMRDAATAPSFGEHIVAR